ncbi:ArnT family glycosyltransferase [Saccharopolyspora taberi]|uniref:Glycosyltransferase RgtA/B/C/D-like domain-containing protein n=1 Tax=Saccharopolyspora taberi TaxID=60895 RepID=A0ABN3V5R2_9PSEU
MTKRWPLAAICGLAALLYGWAIGGTWGNSYYTAAVKSMSRSFENFFFGAFDPAGVITVDKPPMALWVQVVSVKLFGFNQFAVLFPQALAGVAAVFLLHRTVRRWAGEHAALLAALIMALTPITVVINRDNNPDTLLVLLVVAAAYAVTRAMEAERATGWLALAAFLIGCGFLTKMLQAWMVLPAFVAAYLAGRRDSWGRRLVDLAVAAGVLLVSSFWWVVATALWPSPKPFIGGSADGSAWDLVFGYNGFGRILGGEGNGGMPGGGGGFSGESGVLRLFNDQLGGQISWLLPLCALVLVAAVRRDGLGGWVLWGGWLVVVGVMFSFAQGTMHPYYTTMLAPAVSAVAAAGLVRFWRWYRESEGWRWVLLPVAVVVTVAWAFALVARDLTWHAWIGYGAVALAVLGVGALLLGRRWKVLMRSGLALGLAAVLAVPGGWAAMGAVTAQTGMGGGNPTAGPQSSQRMAGRPVEMGSPPGGEGQFGPGGSDQSGPGDGDQSGPGAGQFGPGGGDQLGPGDGDQSGPGADQLGPGGGDQPGPGGLVLFGPGGPGQFGAQQREVLDRVVAEAGDRRIPLAVEGGAMVASSYLINSDVTVVGMGGFTGSDDAPSVRQLTEWKQAGELGFVLLGNGPGRMPGRGGESSLREAWVKQNCTQAGDQLYSCMETGG